MVEMSFANEDSKKNHEVLLLNLSGQKSENIFVADQTPTPTNLIKNCEEVGLFEDLRHVNPFEETFRRAVEQTSGAEATSSHRVQASSQPAEDSLHTPQVFPQLECTVEDCRFRSCEMLDVAGVEDLLSTADGGAYKLSTSRQNSGSSTHSSSSLSKIHKYRFIAEKPTPNVPPSNLNAIQLLQPQMLTISFPSNQPSNAHSHKPSVAAAIPVQSVKPFILPKLSAAPKESCAYSPTIPHEPSSASLTPTYQLPIKERLKAALNQSSRTRMADLAQRTAASEVMSPRISSKKSHPNNDNESLERKRAAATRYRNKMRCEHKELRRKNLELQNENEKLKRRIRQLEEDLGKSQAASLQNVLGTEHMNALSAQIQIPSSTVHLVMNIPQVIVPPNGQPVLQSPITYRVEKK